MPKFFQSYVIDANMLELCQSYAEFYLCKNYCIPKLCRNYAELMQNCLVLWDSNLKTSVPKLTNNTSFSVTVHCIMHLYVTVLRKLSCVKEMKILT